MSPHLSRKGWTALWELFVGIISINFNKSVKTESFRWNCNEIDFSQIVCRPSATFQTLTAWYLQPKLPTFFFVCLRRKISFPFLLLIICFSGFDCVSSEPPKGSFVTWGKLMEAVNQHPTKPHFDAKGKKKTYRAAKAVGTACVFWYLPIFFKFVFMFVFVKPS